MVMVIMKIVMFFILSTDVGVWDVSAKKEILAFLRNVKEMDEPMCGYFVIFNFI